jgi:hypothetical protein
VDITMRMFLVAASAVITACAYNPKTPTPTQSAAAAKSEQNEELIAAVEKAIEQGYKIRNENGQTLYCRKDLKTGTRVRSTLQCLTEDELLAEQRGAKDFVESIQRQPNHMRE